MRLAILALPVLALSACGGIPPGSDQVLSCVHMKADHYLAISQSRSPGFVERTRLNWIEACGLPPNSVMAVDANDLEAAGQ